jgi:uracil-DNA glycosylase
VEDDRSFLRRQVAIYDADLIICCGTGEIVRDREIIQKWDKEQWRTSKFGVKYYTHEIGNKKQIIISFFHPAARLSAESNFMQLLKRPLCKFNEYNKLNYMLYNV